MSIIDNILDFSKLEAGKLGLNDVAFSPRDVLADVAHFLKPLAAEKALNFTTEVSDSVPDTLFGDAAKLKQLLLNLTDNAIKFTQAGQVAVLVGKIDTPDNDGRLLIQISDTGIGMSKDTVDNLFSAFHQADVSATRRFGGTGLGLAVTAQLVQLMGGKIQVDSEPGCGTRVSVELPFTIKTAVNGAAADVSTGLDAEAPVFDTEVLLRSLANDESLARELALAMRTEFPEQLDRLEQSIADNDVAATDRILHTMKGLVAQTGGVRLAAQLTALYAEQRNNQPVGTLAVAALRSEWDKLDKELARYSA
jgi:HPt (histidine-containing phosphotransfer) domain-containing protein